MVRAASNRLTIAAGWGLTENSTGDGSEVLLRVALPFADKQKCRDLYKKRFLESEVIKSYLAN